jgi:DNA topoisomerase-2
MAIAGLSKVGRDKYGVFPLRGKLMNVKDMSVKKIQLGKVIRINKNVIVIREIVIFNFFL